MGPYVTSYVLIATLLVHNSVRVKTMPVAANSDNVTDKEKSSFLGLPTDKQFKEKDTVHHFSKAVQVLEKNHFHWLDIAQLIGMTQTNTDLEMELTDANLSMADKSADVKEIMLRNVSGMNAGATVKDEKMAVTDRPTLETDKDENIIGKDLSGNTADVDLNGKLPGKEIDDQLIATELIRQMVDAALEREIAAGESYVNSIEPVLNNKHLFRTMTDAGTDSMIDEREGASISNPDQEANEERDRLKKEKSNDIKLFEEETTVNGNENFISQLRQVAQPEVDSLQVDKRRLVGCDVTRITYNMLMKYLKTGMFCNGNSFRFRFGVGK